MSQTQRIVAIFSLGALCFVLFLVGLVLVRNKTFKARSHYYTVLSSAKGLSGYPSIFFKGYSIGRVTDFDLTNKLDIKVKFYVFKEYESLMYKHTILEKSQNILSGEITDFKVVLPKKSYREGIKPEGSYVAERGSEEGRALVLGGYVELDSDGIEGVISKVNILLDKFTEQDITKNINKMITDSNDLVLEMRRTVASYHASESPEAKQALIKMVAQANDSVTNINKNLEYLRGILREVYANRDIITPMLMKTSRAIGSAEDTLDGINNNPLIRGGIPKRNKEIKLETSR